MKQNLFRRILALVLALSCLAGCVVVAASAADTATGGSESGSTTDTTLADVKELLNALSYASYSASDAFRFAKPGSESIKIDALGYDAEKTDSKVYRVKIDEKTGIATVVDDSYVPAEGESLGLFMGDSGELVFKLTVQLPRRMRRNQIHRFGLLEGKRSQGGKNTAAVFTIGNDSITSPIEDLDRFDAIGIFDVIF